MSAPELARSPEHVFPLASNAKEDDTVCATEKGPEPSISSRLSSAVRFQQSGDLPGAETLCRSILNSDPCQADALHLLGVISLAGRRFEDAATWIGRALAVDPYQALYHCNAGAAYRCLGRLDLAVESFRSAIKLDPAMAGAHYNLGLLFESIGQNDLAMAELRAAAARAPGCADIWNALGRVTATRNQPEEAIGFYQHSIQLRPSFTEAHYNLGNILFRARRYEEAIAAYQKALQSFACDQRSNGPRPSAGCVARIYNNLGDALKELGRHDEALAAFQNALSLDPNLAEAHNNLGSILQFRGDLDGAEAAYRRALKLSPRFVLAHTNLGNIFGERQCFDFALACYEHALQLDPKTPEARFNRALTLLKIGDYSRGWPEYKWRFARSVPRRDFQEPEWDGSPLHGRALFIYAEQGIGDEVMFASCLPDLTEQIGRVIVECESRVAPLLARSFPWAEIVSRPVRLNALGRINPPVDVQIPMGSLPRILRPNRSSFPKHHGYLRANPGKTSEWKEKFATGGAAVSVGISWRGGNEPDVRRKRSTTAIDWAPLRSLCDIALIDLQYGERGSERDDFRALGLTVQRPPEIDPLIDLDEFTAVVAACDLVVTVDNSTAHLAGALNVPVWTLLSYASDWRWIGGGDDTVWYPCMRLYRQPAAGDWAAVFQRVVADLTDLRKLSAPR